MTQTAVWYACLLCYADLKKISGNHLYDSVRPTRAGLTAQGNLAVWLTVWVLEAGSLLNSPTMAGCGPSAQRLNFAVSTPIVVE